MCLTQLRVSAARPGQGQSLAQAFVNVEIMDLPLWATDLCVWMQQGQGRGRAWCRPSST